MEESLGVALLIRDRRGVQPTSAGRALLHHARSMLQQMYRMHGELDQDGKGLKGHVRLLCNTSALSEYLPDILSDFLTQHPQISVDLEEKMSYDIADAIRNDIADIGIVADSVDLQGLETHVFRPDPLVLRSEEHTSELQSLMRNSYAVFCLKKKKTIPTRTKTQSITQSHKYKSKPAHIIMESTRIITSVNNTNKETS